MHPHMSRPVVAVTATTEITNDVPRVRLNGAYVRAIEDAGLTPLISAPLRDDDPDAAGSVLDAVDGLVLTGGEDVDPACYGAPAHPALGPLNRARDRWELRLAREARARGIPTLGICRGLQLLNVALGGTLVQDIPSERPSAVRHDAPVDRARRVHAVEVDPDSALARALGATTLDINSFHHQALSTVAPGLRVTARAPDGIIEGVESPDLAQWWLVAVQWHPEELVAAPESWDRGLFRAFAERVRQGRD